MSNLEHVRLSSLFHLRVKIVMDKRDEHLCVDPNHRGPQLKFLTYIPQPNHLRGIGVSTQR